MSWLQLIVLCTWLSVAMFVTAMLTDRITAAALDRVRERLEKVEEQIEELEEKN